MSPNSRVAASSHADAQGMVVFFDEANLAIVAALDANDNARADALAAGAWARAAEVRNAHATARAEWCSGLALQYRDPRASLEHYQRAADSLGVEGRHHEQGRALVGCIYQLSLLGQFEEAEQAAIRVEACLQAFPNDPRHVTLLLNKSYLAGCLGRYDDMIALGRASERAAAAAGMPLNVVRGQVNQAIALTFRANLDEAQDLLTTARASAEVSDELSGRVSLNLARIATYRGHMFEALRLLNRARERFAHGGLDLEFSTVTLEEALLYERLSMPGEAIPLAVSAAYGFGQVDLPVEAVESSVLAARLQLQLGRTDDAGALLADASRWVEQISPVARASLTSTSCDARLQRDPAAAKSALVQADGAATTLYKHNAVVEALMADHVAAGLAAKARSSDAVLRYERVIGSARERGLAHLERDALTALSAMQRPKQARRSLRRAADIIAGDRRSLPSEELKARLLSGTSDTYARLIEATLASGDEATAAQTLVEAKGALWCDVAGPRKREATMQSSPEWIRAKAEAQFSRDIALGCVDPEKRELLMPAVQAAEARLIRISREQPRSGAGAPIPALMEVQAILGADEACWEYFVGREHVWCCVLRRDTLNWQKLCKRSEIAAALAQVVLLMSGLQMCDPSQRLARAHGQQAALDLVLRRLSERLVSPLIAVTGEVARVSLAPDAFLHDVPWSAVLQSAMGYPSMDRCPEIALVPSVAALTLKAAGEPATDGRALASEGLPPLTQVEDELAAITRLMPTTECFARARVSDVTSARSPTFLHIAAHSTIAPRSPLMSRIHLADGDLLLAEALALDLEGTSLVVLSACDTGKAPDFGGVALAFSGAFLCAGASVALASLWQVDDASTSLLMRAMYRELGAGAPPASALRRAQAELIGAGYSHPFFWGGFQMLHRCQV